MTSKNKIWGWVLVALGILILAPMVTIRILNTTLGAALLPALGEVNPALLVANEAALALVAVIDYKQACFQPGDPLKVSSHGSSHPQGFPLKYAIDFGDGTDGEAEQAFTSPGVYQVTLTATNSDGDSDVSSRLVSVGLPSFESCVLDKIAFQPNYYDPQILEHDDPPSVGSMRWGFFNAPADVIVSNVLVNNVSWDDPSSVVAWCEVVPLFMTAVELGIARCMSSNTLVWTAPRFC